MPIVSKAADYYLTYRFIKTLVTPFENTKAYELGIVDERGNILKKLKDLNTDEEKKAYGYFDRMVWNIKKILQKIPFMGGRFGSVAAASLLLLKEEYGTEIDELKEMSFLKYFCNDIAFLTEEISPQILGEIERYADKLFAKVGIDVEFTKHFLNRVNDVRNKRQITHSELIRLFRETYKKYGKKIAQLGNDAQAVIIDMQTDVNMPFVLTWDSFNQEFDLIAKTVMRKKDFKTSNMRLSLEAAPVTSVSAQKVAGLEHDPGGIPIKPKFKRKKRKKKRKKFIDFIRR